LAGQGPGAREGAGPRHQFGQATMPWAVGCLCATLVAGVGLVRRAGSLDDNATAGSDRPEMRAARPGAGL